MKELLLHLRSSDKYYMETTEESSEPKNPPPPRSSASRTGGSASIQGATPVETKGALGFKSILFSLIYPNVKGAGAALAHYEAERHHHHHIIFAALPLKRSDRRFDARSSYPASRPTHMNASWEQFAVLHNFSL